MPPAARKTDLTAHGGVIAEGSPDTFIGHLPAARLLDKHMCPLHGPGPITETCKTVFVNGVGVARMGDKCTCMIPSTGKGGGGGEKPKHGKFQISPGAEKKWGEREREWEKDGREDWKEKPGEEKKPEWKPKLAVELASREFGAFGNADAKKGALEGNIYEGKGTARAGAEFESLRNAKAEAGVKYEAEYTAGRARGQVGDVERGSFAQGEGEVKVLTAKAEAGAGGKLEVKDGRLEAAHVEAGGKIGGSVVEGKASGRTRGFRIPFTNQKISFGGEVSGALLTAELGANAHAGLKNNKWSFGFGAKIGAAIAGLGFKFNVTIERDDPPEPAAPPPGVPGVAGIDPIAIGCMTVLIGDFPPPYIPGAPKFQMPSAPAGGAPKGMSTADESAFTPPSKEDYAIAAKEGDTPQQRAARERVAKAFYKQHYPWMKPANINSHVRGIDFAHPVEAVEIPPPNTMSQHTWPGTNPALGNYFALPGTPPTNLGINPKAFNQETGFVEDRPTFAIEPPANGAKVPALKTTASSIIDTWSDEDQPYLCAGGGTQWNIPAKDMMVRGARTNG